MLIAALVLASLAAALHVYIWAMEVLWWEKDSVRATFGTTPEFAAATKGLALNQGFYNLFLALIALAGVIATALGHESIGAALVIAGVGSMLAAALVLFISDRTKAAAAIKQGTLPLLALAALAVALLV